MQVEFHHLFMNYIYHVGHGLIFFPSGFHQQVVFMRVSVFILYINVSGFLPYVADLTMELAQSHMCLGED